MDCLIVKDRPRYNVRKTDCDWEHRDATIARTFPNEMMKGSPSFYTVVRDALEADRPL